jgi:outer membrane immunogenic protein
MRHTLLLATAALLCTALPAFAADLMIDEPAPMMSSSYDWSGAYVGAFGGYSAGTVDWTGEFYSGPTLLGTETGSFDIDGWLVGGTIGANMQTGNFVFGVEGDIAWTNIAGEGDAIDPLDLTPSIPSTAIDYLGTLRVRAGVAADSVLIYATGGLAMAGGDISITNLDGAGDDRTESFAATGWTGGFGAELALADNVSLKAEYLYSALNTDDVNFGSAAPATDVIINGDLGTHTVKVGLNYGF